MNEYNLFSPFAEDFEQTYQLQHEVQNITIYRSIKLEITVPQVDVSFDSPLPEIWNFHLLKERFEI